MQTSADLDFIVTSDSSGLQMTLTPIVTDIICIAKNMLLKSFFQVKIHYFSAGKNKKLKIAACLSVKHPLVSTL